MKTSKLLLLTFIGLIFCVMAVTVDMLHKDITLNKDMLPTSVKTYVEKLFPNGNIAYNKVKDEFIQTSYEIGARNNYYLELDDETMWYPY